MNCWCMYAGACTLVQLLKEPICMACELAIMLLNKCIHISHADNCNYLYNLLVLVLSQGLL